MIRRLIATALTILSTAYARAAEVEAHYAPVENLERIDIELIRSASKSIDVAIYTLTDWAIIGALEEARRRGVAVRITLDPTVRQAYDKLVGMADVVRVKRSGPLMHLKAYVVDGTVLRTGSANLSPSGLKQQDNDLLILRNDALAAKFEARFAEIYAAADPMRFEEPAAPADTPRNSTCRIKGNVGRKGERIYHEPGDRDYDRVVMDTTKGKRWFCSEAEAEAAGWRHALR
jgi:phosphatidylserine/phosphatidylglycerophosphate/cardiolipin synthase-like enzyme